MPRRTVPPVDQIAHQGLPAVTLTHDADDLIDVKQPLMLRDPVESTFVVTIDDHSSYGCIARISSTAQEISLNRHYILTTISANIVPSHSVVMI